MYDNFKMLQGYIGTFHGFKAVAFKGISDFFSTVTGQATASIATYYAMSKAIEYFSDKYNLSYDSAIRNTKEHVDELNTTKTELSDLQSQTENYKSTLLSLGEKYSIDLEGLDTVDEILNKIKSSDVKLELVDQVEIGKIENANSALERQISIKEKLAESQQKDAASDAIDTLNRGKQSVAQQVAQDIPGGKKTYQGMVNNVNIVDAIKEDISAIQEYKNEIKYLEEWQEGLIPGGKSWKKAEKNLQSYNEAIEKLTSDIETKETDLNTLLSALSVNGDGLEALKGYEEEFKEVKSAFEALNNIDLSPTEQALKSLDSYFDGSASKNALKKQLTEAAKSGKNLETVLNRMGLSLSDLGANVDLNTLKQYFDDIKSSAQEAGEVAKNYKASVSDVEEAVASENQDKDWSTIQSSYEAAKKLLQEGKTGTDDFQTMASFLNPKKVKEYAEQGGKYTADAYQKAFQEIQTTADRWFGEDETKSMENFVNDFKNKGLWDVATDDMGLWDISTNFKTTAKAADEFGVSIEAVETMLHGLEAYGYDFSNIMFSGESLSEYKSSLNEIKAIYDKMGEGPAKDRLGTLIEGFDKELAGFENDMSSLTEDKIVHIQFEYDIASIQAEIDAIDQKEKTGGEIGRDERSDRIINRDLKYEEQVEGFGFDNKDVEIPLQFKVADDAVSKAKDDLQKAVNSGNATKIDAAQIKVENAQKLRDEIATSFDEWNQKQEIPITFKSNVDEINSAIESFTSAPTIINVEAKLNKDEVEASMSSMSAESVITFTADYNGIETQVAAVKDQKGNITYVATIDGEPTEVELNKDGTIEYDADMAKADAAKAPEKSSIVSYAARFLSATAPTLSGTVNYTAVISGVSSVVSKGASVLGSIPKKIDGTAHAQGTAHAEGTAKASGDWSVKKNETALTGEVGQEVVVRKGKFFTVGDNGAEMVDLQKGDIVFNHKQTEELFKHGYVTSNGGRGKVVGEAHAEGTAYRLGSGKPAGGSRPKTKPAASSSNNSSPAPDNSSSDSAKDFKETIDYIEMAINRIERQIKNVERIAGSAYNTFAKRNNALKDQLSSINDELDIQQAGYDRYIQEADSVSLSEDYKEQVRNGTIDISTITDESLAENIKDFQQW